MNIEVTEDQVTEDRLAYLHREVDNLRIAEYHRDRREREAPDLAEMIESLSERIADIEQVIVKLSGGRVDWSKMWNAEL